MRRLLLLLKLRAVRGDIRYAQSLIAHAEQQQRQIADMKQQAARIAGLTWRDVACAIRALGMPQANEDLQALLGALSHIVVESGMDDPEGCVMHLDKASDAAEALRVMDSDEMALAHREYVREMEDDDRRAGLV